MKARHHFKSLVALCLTTCSAIGADVDAHWCRSQVDVYVQEKHREAAVHPNSEASRATLLRRLSLDLLGLPPRAEDVDAFVGDESGDAYEKQVDRLLASPHFGERMAQFWLDLARYADSDGYHDDINRSMWPYRDWVIRAFNSSKPFDTFTIEQLAGDLLPNPSTAQLVATAFHRNGPTTSEDGANPDEYRARYTVDRVNTTAQVWLALTIQCAECHDHKYDPISTLEYYQLFDFFNHTDEQPLFGGLYAPPSIAIPTRQQQARIDEFKQLRSAKQSELRRLAGALEGARETWQAQLIRQSDDPIEREAVVCELRFEAGGEHLLKNTGRRRISATARPGADGVTPTWSRGLDGAVRYSGNGEAIELGNLVEFRRTVPFTVEFWLKHQAPAGVLLSKLDSNNHSRGFDVRIDDHRVSVRLIDAWPDAAIQISTVDALQKDSWNHVSITYDGSSTAAGIHIYVNGHAQDLRIDRQDELESIRSRAPLLIGGAAEQDGSFRGLMDEVRVYKWPLTSFQLEQAPNALLRRLASVPQPPPPVHRFVTDYFRDFVNPPTLAVRRQLAQLARDFDSFLHGVQRVRVMRNSVPERKTYVLVRGDFRRRGSQVHANTPSMLPPLPPRRNNQQKYDRLDLANWLVGANRDHTARVFANRLWALFFARGIVPTLDDFGVQGDPASHPELLDWLAEELIRTEWDVKSLVRAIVTSAAYRQSSAASPESWNRDPHNRLLARGPRHRLPAETIRDNALCISGLLSSRIGGPSVRPYQPTGLWRAMSKGDDPSKSYIPSTGEDLYRRGIYTFWKRSIHYPTFAILDAPSREVCTSSRPMTNTATQALVLLNDPTFVEAARALATSLVEQSNDEDQRITLAFRRALGRPPSRHERKTLQRMLLSLSSSYRDALDAAQRLLAVGASESPEGDLAELAAWTALMQVMLTFDETITKQ